MYRDGHQHMIATVSADFRVSDVVGKFHNAQIRLLCQHISNPVNILGKGTDDTNTGDVGDIL